jgi:uncharacterized protein (DUF1800 family)
MAFSLSPFSTTLGLRRAKHLLRRASFNFSKETLDLVSAMTASEALTFLSENPTDIIAEPHDYQGDGYWTSSTELPASFSGQGRKRAYICGWWWYNAINQTSLKHKLSYFLFTSFTVSNGNGAGSATYFYDYLRLLDFYAMGNIKTLAKKITLDNAMLKFLNNTDNNADNPNENYGREFLELFTILKGAQISEGNYTNYTELDVQQAAKVFTGFKTRNDRSIIDPDTNLPIGYNNINKHDTSDKVFSSAFNNHVITGQNTSVGMTQELDDFVEMIFNQEETAKSYCRKLYRYFVKSEWDSSVESEIIEPLAQELITNNFELLPTVTTLLSSQHFFDEDNSDASDEVFGSIVKSPLQLLNEVISFFNISIPNPTTSSEDYYNKFIRKFIFNSYMPGAGMNFFSPDSVAGYPAHYQEPDFDRHWFSSSTIVARYKLIESLIAGRNKIFPNDLTMVQVDTVSFVENNIENPGDITNLVTELTTYLFPEDIDTNRRDYFIGIALDGYEAYYWSGAWGAYLSDGDDVIVRNRLNALITAMVNAAEFQLM